MIEVSSSDWATAKRDDSTNVLRVLLAEDTQISAEAMKAMGRRLAVDMDTVSNGLEAIEKVEEAEAEGRPYCLMLVDVMMPVLDGIETTKRLRELGYNAEKLPIVAVTAATSMDEIRSYRASGMQAFLSKPVSLKDLRAVFEAWGHSAEERPFPVHLDALKELQRLFAKRTEHTSATIAAALANGDVTDEKIFEIRSLLHQIAGTAASFGDPGLSKAARRHEERLVNFPRDKATLRRLLEDAGKSLDNRKLSA